MVWLVILPPMLFLAVHVVLSPQQNIEKPISTAKGPEPANVGQHAAAVEHNAFKLLSEMLPAALAALRAVWRDEPGLVLAGVACVTLLIVGTLRVLFLAIQVGVGMASMLQTRFSRPEVFPQGLRADAAYAACSLPGVTAPPTCSPRLRGLWREGSSVG